MIFNNLQPGTGNLAFIYFFFANIIEFAGKVKVPEAGSKSVTPSEAKPIFC